MNTDEKLKLVREAMQHAGLDGFIQPLHDEFLSEYPPDCAKRLQWLCGFTGSAGTLVVLQEKAALFTDGRYTLQAAQEVDETLFEQHNISVMQPEDWLATHAHDLKIGYDAGLFTAPILTRFEKAADGKLRFVPAENAIDSVWHDQPDKPATPLFAHEAKYNGKPSAEKREALLKLMQEKQADAMLLCAPDSVCWLLNIRAADVEHTPLVLAAALVKKDGSAVLFVDPARCSDSVQAHLTDSVQLKAPDAVTSELKALGKSGARILLDASTTPLWYVQALDGADMIKITDPCQLAKAMKNRVELEGIRAAHIRDGAAVVKLLHWLDENALQESVTELDVCDQLLSLRAQHDLFHDASFPTIAGSGPNGAIVHYRATEHTNRSLGAGELFLLDSGGQYPDGTTDITRTVPIGAPSAEMCDRFTRVLKGHIALATARFPRGTTGAQLDTLARQHLWQAGVDYDHGTGHGVGCFLGVHEGPQGISKRSSAVALQPGMILSNEPGYYKSGAYGIRIENLVAVVESGDGAGGKAFYGFDTITCAPIDTRLVLTNMLCDEEKQWLNSYHEWVEDSLKDFLGGPTKKWLAERCAAI